MPTKINQEAFAGMLRENVAWLRSQKRTLERDHTIEVLECLVREKYMPERSTRTMARMMASSHARVVEASCATPSLRRMGISGVGVRRMIVCAGCNREKT